MAIYMYKEEPYEPTNNTKLYFPMEGDLTNYGTKGGSWINSGGSLSFEDNCVVLENGYFYSNPSIGDENIYGTFSLWLKNISTTGYPSYNEFITVQSYSFGMYGGFEKFYYTKSNGQGIEYSVDITNPQQRHWVCVVTNSNQHVVYIDNVQKHSQNVSTGYMKINNYILDNAYSSNAYSKMAYGEFIIDGDARSATERTNYYNKSKKKYGL